jgi:hypothetical protein
MSESRDDALNIALGLPVGTPTPSVPSFDVVKVATYISITREILRDVGYEGTLAKDGPEPEHWRRAWHRQERMRHIGVSGLFMPLYSPPPWEDVDPPALPRFRIWRWGS